MQNTPNVNIEEIKEIFKTGDAQRLVEFAADAGKQLAMNNVSTSQVRNILDSIQAIKEYKPNSLQLLRPLLAYSQGKKPNLALFRQIIEAAIESVHSEGDFKFFRHFVEAIVAYHTLEETKRKEQERMERRSR